MALVQGDDDGGGLCGWMWKGTRSRTKVEYARGQEAWEGDPLSLKDFREAKDKGQALVLELMRST
jgi:hypothetical protein